MPSSTAPRRTPRSWVPCLLTGANVTLGFFAIVAAAEARFEQAVWLLVLAIVLDTLDGAVARWLGATSEFGRELDSFADALSSGAAPALLLYLAVLRPLGPLGLALAAAYLVCGVLRLARYNLGADAHVKAPRTTGLPIPIAAGYVMAIVLMRDEIEAWWAAPLVAVIAVAMISRWSLPELKRGSPVTAGLFIGIANYLAVVIWPNWVTVVWWNLWNAVILLAARMEDRRLALEREVEEA
jgi:CDP-diacylglycerol--serine O-phosphatidyltransferase